MPWGRRTRDSTSSSFSPSRPRSSKLFSTDDLYRSLITTLSPHDVGTVETLTSMSLPPILSLMPPSWGFLLSAMSSSDMIFTREMTEDCTVFGTAVTSWRMPSFLNLTDTSFSKHSMWMSLACSLTARKRSVFMNFMIGASSRASMRSSGSANSASEIPELSLMSSSATSFPCS